MEDIKEKSADEDIKIVEKMIENYKIELEVSERYTLDGFKPMILKRRISTLENLLSRLKTAERMNDVLAEKIESHCNYEYICFITSHHTYCAEHKITKKECKQCIKEWARKKVEDEQEKR